MVTAINGAGHRFKSSPTNKPRFTAPSLPWWSPISNTSDVPCLTWLEMTYCILVWRCHRSEFFELCLVHRILLPSRLHHLSRPRVYLARGRTLSRRRCVVHTSFKFLCRPSKLVPCFATVDFSWRCANSFVVGGDPPPVADWTAADSLEHTHTPHRHTAKSMGCLMTGQWKTVWQVSSCLVSCPGHGRPGHRCRPVSSQRATTHGGRSSALLSRPR